MRIIDWDRLPENMRTDAVRPYYESLRRKGGALICKRIFDVVVSLIALAVLLPLLLLLCIVIICDSRGGPFFLQKRVTAYGKPFTIVKFRTMVKNAESLGGQVTASQDARVTRVGRFLRKIRLDELPQLWNILTGDMTFVGVRPEVPKYVSAYTDAMRATLLLPAGVTSRASLLYKDEEKLLQNAVDSEQVYITQVLPEKMTYNLEELKNFSFLADIKTLFATLIGVLK